MRVRVVSRPAFAAGFELAGLPVTRVDDGRAATHAVTQFAADADVGIVLVDDTLYRALPHETLRRLERRALPMIVSVTMPRWDERSEAEAYILEILRQVIGYRVRPR